ncbi:MAG: superoxide dismutase [Myxococcales bacterium]|nr:superoxide dismutase [Myxococcales bacterium]
MAFELPALPYSQDALEPHYSARTLSFHHGKHHKAYVDKTNELIAGTDLAEASLETIIRTAVERGQAGLFNQSAQIWNHTFFWNSMKPNGGGAPTSKLAASALGNFGSGWTWLVEEGGALKIVNTTGAGTPLTTPTQTALLTVDVWEHAYYLDYQNLRAKFVQTFFDKLVNWDFAAANMG